MKNPHWIPSVKITRFLGEIKIYISANFPGSFWHRLTVVSQVIGVIALKKSSIWTGIFGCSIWYTILFIGYPPTPHGLGTPYIFWLVVWLPFFIFPYIGNNHPNWLSYFSEGFKPTTNQFWANLHPLGAGPWPRTRWRHRKRCGKKLPDEGVASFFLNRKMASCRVNIRSNQRFYIAWWLLTLEIYGDMWGLLESEEISWCGTCLGW